MSISPEEILKADLTKLHNEVNQLRNHEFLVSSFALALVGATAAELKQGPAVGLGILVVLLCLFYWHHTLIDTRSRLTSYLRATRTSQWELLYRSFADDTPHTSQRTAGVVTFAVLGALVPVITFRDGIAAYLNGQPYDLIPGWIKAYGGICSAYFGSIIYFGRLKNYKDTLDEYKLRWEKLVIQSNNVLQIDQNTSSNSENVK